MKVGVSGADGHLGRAVVSELRQRAGGHEVVAITPDIAPGVSFRPERNKQAMFP